MPWRDLTLHSTPKQHPPAPWVVGTQLPWSRVEVAAREPCSVEIVRKVLNPDTVPFRPTRLVIVIRGSSRRIFSQVSSVIRGSAAGLDFMSSFFFSVGDTAWAVSVSPLGPAVRARLSPSSGIWPTAIVISCYRPTPSPGWSEWYSRAERQFCRVRLIERNRIRGCSVEASVNLQICRWC